MKKLLIVVLISIFSELMVSLFANTVSTTNNNTVENGRIENKTSIFTKQIGNPNQDYYHYLSDHGKQHLINKLKRSNYFAAKLIVDSRAYVTSILNVRKPQHILFMGFSNGLVGKVVFSDVDFDNIKSFILIQNNPNRKGWNGEITSIAYDKSDNSLYVGLGSEEIEIDNSFSLSDMLGLPVGIYDDWHYTTYKKGGSVWEYYDNNWENLAPSMFNSLGVESLRPYELQNGKKYLLVFMNPEQAPQEFKFSIALSSPKPPFVDVDMSGGDIETPGLRHLYNLYSIDITPGSSRGSIKQIWNDKWGETPITWCYGSNPHSLLFFAFSDHNIWFYNAAYNRGQGCWEVAKHAGWGGRINVLLHSEINNKEYLIACLDDGTIHKLTWKAEDKPVDKGWDTIQGPGWGSSIDMSQVSKDGKYFTLVLNNGIIMFREIAGNDKKFDLGNRDGIPTAISKPFYKPFKDQSGGNYCFFVGYSNGIILRILINPDSGSRDLKKIRDIQPLVKDIDGIPLYPSSGTIPVLSQKPEFTFYPESFDVDGDHLFVNNGMLLGKNSISSRILPNHICGMGISSYNMSTHAWKTVLPNIVYKNPYPYRSL
jgi:hypothetical protein